MPTDDYYRALAASKRLHARTTKRFNGRFLFRYLDDIGELIERYECKTLLDVGCGRAIGWTDPLDEAGTMLKNHLGLTEVRLYDPAFPAYAAEPVGEWDIVICTQALGSIPVSDLPWAISRLYGWASKVVYVGERLGPVRKKTHKDMADAGLMPHGWTRGQWVQALASVERSAPAVYLRTKDKRDGESRYGTV